MDVNTGLVITGVVAALYGVGFAVVPKAASTGPGFQRGYVLGGAALVAICALAFVIIPWMGER